MTARPNHRAEAERLLADADEWAEQAGELSPKASERACLDRAQVHALLAIHDTLTAADRYFAIEAKQRDAEWLVLDEGEDDQLDEDDHRDRLTADSRRIVRHGQGHWHTPAISGTWCDADCTEMSLRDWARAFGPLTFAPEPPPDAARDDLTASEGESEAEERGEAGDAQEALLCPECGHGIDRHTYDCPGDRCRDCDDCPRALSDVARALIAEAVKAERLRLAREVLAIADALAAPDADGAPSVTTPVADDPGDDAVDGEEGERRNLNAQDAEFSRLLAVSTDPTAAFRRTAMMEAMGVTDDQAKWFAQILAKGRLLPSDLQRLKERGDVLDLDAPTRRNPESPGTGRP